MNINEKDEEKVIFNTPANFNISTAFPEFTSKDLPKIEFLINQINYKDTGRGYQVHIAKHAWAMCMSNGEITSILKKLVELNIIRKVSEGLAGINSNAYAIVKPYSNDNSKKSWYAVNDYLFLQKLKGDKWVAKGKQHSAYIKPPAKVSIKIERSALEAENQMLRELLAENNISIPVKELVEIIPEKKATVMKLIQPDIQTVDFAGLQLQVDNFSRYEEAIKGLTEVDEIDLKLEIISAIANKEIGDKSISIGNRVFNFFINHTVNFIEFKHLDVLEVA